VNFCGVSLAIMEKIIPTGGYLIQKRWKCSACPSFVGSWCLEKKLQVERLNHSNWYQERKYEATTNGHQWTVSLHSLDLLPRCSDFDFACANHRRRKNPPLAF